MHVAITEAFAVAFILPINNFCLKNRTWVFVSHKNRIWVFVFQFAPLQKKQKHPQVYKVEFKQYKDTYTHTISSQMLGVQDWIHFIVA